MKESVLDVLMYLFENYQEGEFADSDNQDTVREELVAPKSIVTGDEVWRNIP